MTSQDYKKAEPTKNEKLIYELIMATSNLEKTVAGLHRMMTAMIGVNTNIDMTELVKTMRNDIRIKSILNEIQKTEVGIIAEEAELAKKKEGETNILSQSPTEDLAKAMEESKDSKIEVSK